MMNALIGNAVLEMAIGVKIQGQCFVLRQSADSFWMQIKAEVDFHATSWKHMVMTAHHASPSVQIAILRGIATATELLRIETALTAVFASALTATLVRTAQSFIVVSTLTVRISLIGQVKSVFHILTSRV
jgi:hypothetical protein